MNLTLKLNPIRNCLENFTRKVRADFGLVLLQMAASKLRIKTILLHSLHRNIEISYFGVIHLMLLIQSFSQTFYIG